MIKDNIIKVRERIKAASLGAGGDPQGITLVAVTKGRDIPEIMQAIEAGITDIGENRVQEALEKYNQLYSIFDGRRTTDDERRTIKWHFVGHLQTNKVQEAVKIFDLIQSVDSLRLAQEIAKQAAGINKIQDILVEIKTSPEESKSGIKPDAAAEVMAVIARLKNVSIKGLMTIAPQGANPESARPYFRQLRELKDRLNERRTSAKRSVASPKGTNDGIRILSMGMTDDFEAAIIEGATMVRIGRAIFD